MDMAQSYMSANPGAKMEYAYQQAKAIIDQLPAYKGMSGITQEIDTDQSNRDAIGNMLDLPKQKNQ